MPKTSRGREHREGRERRWVDYLVSSEMCKSKAVVMAVWALWLVCQVSWHVTATQEPVRTRLHSGGEAANVWAPDSPADGDAEVAAARDLSWHECTGAVQREGHLQSARHRLRLLLGENIRDSRITWVHVLLSRLSYHCACWSDPCITIVINCLVCQRVLQRGKNSTNIKFNINYTFFLNIGVFPRAT